MTKSGPGIFYDGQSARPNTVTVTLTPGKRVFLTDEDGEAVASWPFDDVRMADAPPGLLRLRVETDEQARLEVSDPMFAQALLQACTSLKNRDAIERSATLKIVGWSIAACVSMVLLAVYGVPAIAERLVPFVPYSVDRQLGAGVKASLVQQLSKGEVCKPGPDAKRAFERMKDRLLTNADGLNGPVDIVILPSPIKNAFALPGGHVMILSGLLENAANADELAGVLAHELGHVAGRHSMHKLVAESGLYFLLGIVLGDFGGSTVIIAGSRAILSAGYSRDAEREADKYAIELMGRAGGNPDGLATLLERIASVNFTGALGLLSTHPHTKERAAEIRATADALTDGRSVGSMLDEEEWQALKTYCTNTQ